MRTTHFIGIDLGQRRDYTALAVARRRERQGPWDPVLAGYPTLVRLEFVYSARFVLGTSYVEIAAEVRNLVQRMAARGEGVRIAVDATGVGSPVVDLLQALGMRAVVWPVTIAGSGDGMRGALGQEYFTVTKAKLFYGLLVALEQKRTVFSGAMAGLEEVEEELCRLGSVYTERGMRVTGAAGAKHDDLAFAVALAQWAASKAYPADIRRGLSSNA